jgi:hypothetical protein
MRAAILLFALVLVAPPAVFAASFERQNEAVKQCQQLDVDDRAAVFLKCMEDAGLHFCGKCSAFGEQFGPFCDAAYNAMERPACWYRCGEKPETRAHLLVRWQKWAVAKGWLNQIAPFGPDPEPKAADADEPPSKNYGAAHCWPEYTKWYKENHCYSGPDGHTLTRARGLRATSLMRLLHECHRSEGLRRTARPAEALSESLMEMMRDPNNRRKNGGGASGAQRDHGGAGARRPQWRLVFSFLEIIADGRVAIAHRGPRDVVGWSMVASRRGGRSNAPDAPRV